MKEGGNDMRIYTEKRIVGGMIDSGDLGAFLRM
jgi:hypothetical protein